MPFEKKPAVTSAAVHDLIRHRWSPRAIASTPVEHEKLVSVLEAARWAASSNNAQPWRFIVATSDDAEGFAAALSGFNPRNQRWAKGAPVLIIALARKTFEANGNPNTHAAYDTGAAIAQLSLQATELGLVVHQAAGLDRDRIREVFAVPEEFDILTASALGYPGDPDSLPEELPGREKEPRVRKPLAEIFFSGKFGTPLKGV